MSNVQSLSGGSVDATHSTGDKAAALRAVDQALASSPDDIRLLETRAALRIQLEDWDGALADWTRLRTLSPHSLAALLPKLWSAQLERGVNAVREQHHDVAVRGLEPATDAMPGNPRAQFFLGSARAGLGDSERAVSAFRQALTLGPRSESVALALGLHLLALGRPAEAERVCRRIVEPTRFLAQGWRTLGAAQAQLGRLEEARDAYERAAATEPLSADLMDAQKVACERGVPPIVLVAAQKSASEYIRDVLLRALDVRLCYPDLGTHPRNRLIPTAARQMARGGLLARLHLDGSPENLDALRHAGIERVFVHLRDPRQTTLSWVHHLNRIPQAQFDRFRNYYLPAVPAAFRGWQLAVQLQWATEHYFPAAAEVVRGWLAAPATSGLRIEISCFERFAEDPAGYLRRMLEFYGCPDVRLDEALSAIDARARPNFRLGHKDEWRTVLTPAQQRFMNRLVEPDWTARMGWPAH
jgi:Flp pilus assembly protein TadD